MEVVKLGIAETILWWAVRVMIGILLAFFSTLLLGYLFTR
jgi:hypothetical protein